VRFFEIGQLAAFYTRRNGATAKPKRLTSNMTLGAVGVALEVLKVRSYVATRPKGTNGLIALCT
jgi:hypothetical protein